MAELLQDSQALWLTLKLAFFTTLILLVVTIPLCWKISQYHGFAKPLIEAAIALPLVLPPTVLGFYLLLAFSPDVWFGNFYLKLTGQQLSFSFQGILIASLIYSLPFVAQPILAAFKQVGVQQSQVAASLGIPPVKRFFLLILPAIKPALISATTLGFAHTLGEFGLILMIGGNLPGETQVLSIALYNHVETLNYQQAHRLAGVLLIFSFLALSLLYKFNRSVLEVGK